MKTKRCRDVMSIKEWEKLICQMCKEYKTVDNFYIVNMKYYSYCKECVKNRNKTMNRAKIDTLVEVEPTTPKVPIIMVKEPVPEFKEKYPAPNIDEVIWFIPTVKEEEEFSWQM